MPRLTLLFLALALSLAMVVPAAHAATADAGGSTASAAQQSPPPDRDGDGAPDSSDQCPDTPGTYSGCPDRDGDTTPDNRDQCPDTPGQYNGCPTAPDRDGDGTSDANDQCPDTPGTSNGCPEDKDRDGTPDASDQCPNTPGQSNNGGCPPVVWKYFFGTENIKHFASDKPNDNTYCTAGVLKCKTVHVTITLSAATAKAAGIAKRQISSFSVSLLNKYSSNMGFDRNLSSVNKKKLARLKKITLTIDAYVIFTNGQRIDADAKTKTIYRHQGAGATLNSTGTTDPEGI